MAAQCKEDKLQSLSIGKLGNKQKTYKKNQKTKRESKVTKIYYLKLKFSATKLPHIGVGGGGRSIMIHKGKSSQYKLTEWDQMLGSGKTSKQLLQTCSKN